MTEKLGGYAFFCACMCVYCRDVYQEKTYSDYDSARILRLVFEHRSPKISADFDEFVFVSFPNRHYSAIFVVTYNEIGLHSRSFHYGKVYHPFVHLYENSF